MLRTLLKIVAFLVGLLLLLLGVLAVALPRLIESEEFTSTLRTNASEALGSPVVQVKIGTYSGTPGTTISTANITPINSTTVTIPNQTNPGTNIVAPITGVIPANGQLVVELFKPGMNTSTVYFYVGASNSGETKPGYFRAPSCLYQNVSIATPTTPGSIGVPTAQLNITVTGVR